MFVYNQRKYCAHRGTHGHDVTHSVSSRRRQLLLLVTVRPFVRFVRDADRSAATKKRVGAPCMAKKTLFPDQIAFDHLDPAIIHSLNFEGRFRTETVKGTAEYGACGVWGVEG